MSVLMVLVISCGAVLARTNNYIKTFRNYENLLLRRAVFMAYCNDQQKMEQLKVKINELVEKRDIPSYYYLVESDENFRLKCEQIKTDFVNNAGYHALKGKFHPIDNLEKHMASLPNGAFLGDLLQITYERLAFDSNNKSNPNAESIKEQLPRIQALLVKAAKMAEKQIPQAMIQKIMGWEFPKFWDWYKAGMKVSVSDKHQTGAAFESSKLNLNTASLNDLKAIPGFDDDLAGSVHSYIQSNKGINSYKELLMPVAKVMMSRFEKQEAIVRTRVIISKLQILTYISDKTLNKKKWTFMVFINADNNLEGAGIGDINEMEKVGSDENMNIVVQIDRHEDSVDANNQEHVYDVSNGNWTGTRRYYIERDNNESAVSSQVKRKLGEDDVGTVSSLTKFVKWSIDSYPAEHYYLIVWNHGGGLDGISWDDQSGSHISAEQLMEAVDNASKIAGKKIDIVNFDACLMAMLEIALQLKDNADIMIASEEVEPGYGLPYTDILVRLAAEPNITPDELAKHVVNVYTNSYRLGGSQAQRRAQSVTYSAVKLDKLDGLVKALDELALVTMNNFADYVRAIHQNTDFKLRTYHNGQHDMVDYVSFMATKVKNADIRKAARKVLRVYGYPMDQRKNLSTFEGPINIIAAKGSVIRWGVNGFTSPKGIMDLPANTTLYDKYAETVVTEAGDDNRYGLVIGNLPDEVHNIYYRVKKPEGKRFGRVKVASRKDYFYTDKFSSKSPLLAEGHTKGMEFSYGLAINICNTESFNKRYQKLRFAKESNWDEMLTSMTSFEKKNDILLIPDCGNDFRNDLHLADYANMLKGKKFDVFDFRYYNKFDADLLDQYRDGYVIVFAGYNDDMGTLTDRYRKPDGSIGEKKRHIFSPEQLASYLDNGGKLIISGHDIEKDVEAANLFNNYLNVSIDGEKKEENIVIKGTGEISSLSMTDKISNVNNEYHPPYPAVMTPKASAIPVFTYEDGSCAGVMVKENHKAAYMGFEIESMNDNNPKKVLRSIMKELAE
jgi:DNA uptake protein ComE-like DNA-binding protein